MENADFSTSERKDCKSSKVYHMVFIRFMILNYYLYHTLTKCLFNDAVIENLLLILLSNRYFSFSPDALSKIVLIFNKKKSSVSSFGKFKYKATVPYTVARQNGCHQRHS